MDPETWAQFVADVTEKVRAGIARDRALRACGITAAKQKKLQKLANDGYEPAYSFFADVLPEAEASAEVSQLDKIKASKDWKASAWILERKYPDRWGQKVQIEVKEEVEKVFAAAKKVLPPDLYEEFLKEIEKSDRGDSSPNRETAAHFVEDRLH